MVKLVKIVTHSRERERAAKLYEEEGVIAIGWHHNESIANKTKDEIKQTIINEEELNPEEAERAALQLITFRDKIEIGDIVFAYKTDNIIALVGEVTGDYEFNTKNNVGKPEEEGGLNHQHQRNVRWWDKPRNFNRSYLPQDLSKKIALPGTISILSENIDIHELKTSLDSIPSNIDPEEVEIVNEDEIKEYLRNNLNKLEEGLEFVGKEYKVLDDRIDILAKDKNGLPVVIEVKVCADDSAVGQILGYIQTYEEENGAKQVRGILVAKEFTERCKKAAKRAGIKLYRCKKIFKFEAIDYS
jgi:predicted Mrr-cat superfamily restriction endonuclease